MPAAGGVSPATIALLWGSASPWPDVEAIRRAAVAAPDLAHLSRAAERHRVGPLVLRSLRLAGNPIDLRGWADRLVAEAGLRRAQEAVALPTALRIGVAPLVAAGLEPVVLKGPALLARYPERGLRAMDDIDVLVPGRANADAARVLEAHGWHRVAHAVDPGYDTAFSHPEAPGLALELHREVENRWARPRGMRGEMLWQTRRPATIVGVDAFVLPPEEELCFLAAHSAKPWHVFNRLVWLADLVVVTRGALDWDRAVSLATRHQCRTALAVGLTLALRLGATAPRDAVAVDVAGWRLAWLDELLRPDWPFIEPEPGMRRRLSVVLADRWVDRVRLVAGTVIGPGGQGQRVAATSDALRHAERLVTASRRRSGETEGVERGVDPARRERDL